MAKPHSSPPREPDWNLYQKHAEQAWKDLQSSSDDFDKNLLTFSSGALALSLSFIKDLVPLKEAVGRGWLYVSWVAFALCILTTIFSFPLSIQAQKRQLDYLYKYYIDCDDCYFNRESVWSWAVTLAGVLGSVFFVIGLVATVLFAIVNVWRIH